jgi:aryl-alcohol dehydrogenase-like predicted oxidoreductase
MEYHELGRDRLEGIHDHFGRGDRRHQGNVKDEESLAPCTGHDLGVNFFDTADVYGDGHSEQLLAMLRKERSEPFYIATKVGRRSDPHVAVSYTKENLTAYVESSLRNLELEALDLVQLHSPPTQVYYMPEAFDALDDLVKAGKLRYYGVSVEKVEEALKAIEYPNMQSVQIIFNIFRQRPLELFFGEAQRRKVGILARVPLSSGMLTGKMSRESTFEQDDHRHFNRQGEAFDRGETFSGLDYEIGLQAVEELRALVPAGMSMSQMALRWILMSPAVTCAIPGAKRPSQVEENVSAADLPPLPEETMSRIREVYERLVRPQVHHYW